MKRIVVYNLCGFSANQQTVTFIKESTKFDELVAIGNQLFTTGGAEKYPGGIYICSGLDTWYRSYDLPDGCKGWEPVNPAELN